MAKQSLKDILSGDFLSNGWLKRQYKLIILISILIFLHIYSDYQSQRQQKELSDLRKELMDAKMTHLTVSAELMEKTRQSSISRMLKEQGSKVKESNKPTIRID
jgi:hypothetical protein